MRDCCVIHMSKLFRESLGETLREGMRGRRHLLTLLAPFPLLLLLGEIKILQHPHISYICEIFVEHGDGDIDM